MATVRESRGEESEDEIVEPLLHPHLFVPDISFMRTVNT